MAKSVMKDVTEQWNKNWDFRIFQNMQISGTI